MKDVYQKGQSYMRIVEPGNGSRYFIVVGFNEDRVPFVALPDYGKAAVMAWYGYATAGYVREKLNISIPDSEAVAEILNSWVIDPARERVTAS